MAQTATEWLFEKMAQTPITDWYNVREQSNEIFKQQIIEAANFLPHDEQNNIKTSEQYYNETYNK